MALEKGLKEVGGQLVLDRPWHCALCRRRYTRRVYIEFWELTARSLWARRIVRLCVGDETSPGCFEMGLQQLFFRAKNVVRRLRDRRKAA